MPTDRVHAALLAAAARRAALTAEQEAECDMLLLLMTHRIMCCPSFKDGRLYHPLPEDRPAISGEGCVCKGVPMKVLGPDHFLRLRENAA